MGKRNKRQGKGIAPAPVFTSETHVVDSDDSETSVTTTLSGFTVFERELNEIDLHSHSDLLDDVIIETTEKRTETRLKAFKDFNELLCRRCCRDWLERNYDRMTTAIFSSLKRSHSSPDLAAECVLVCRTIGLTAISLGSDAVTNLFDTFYPLLCSGIEHNSDRAACKQLCEVLCVLIICMEGESSLDDIMLELQTHWMNEERPIENRSSILHTWYVCIAQSEMQDVLLQKNMDVLLDLVDLIESDCVPMRIHAAECVTLFVDIYRNLNEPLEFDLEEDTGISIDDLIEMFTGLTGDRRSAPKKALTGQRKKFRILLETLENGVAPEICFSIRKEKCKIRGCSEVIQIECFRKVLRSGFQVHLIDNDIIQRRFGLTNIPVLLERRKHATQDEKDYEKYSKTLAKKDRQKQRDRQRDAKRAMIYA